MEHLESGCVQMLADILQGQIRRRFRMENELLELWLQARAEWMSRPNPPMMYSTQEWTGQVVMLWDGKKEVGEQTLLSRVVTHRHNGWSLITDVKYDDLVNIAGILNIPTERIPDIYVISVDNRDVLLYDPMNHFWRDPCDS